MRMTKTRIAAALTALAAGGLATVALRPSSTSRTTSLASASQPAVEVRTQVIRRTIHVVRHEHPPRPMRPRTTAGAGPSPRTGSAGATVGSAAAVTPRTASSGSHTAVSSAPAASVPAPVRTRTSGAPSSGNTGGKGSGTQHNGPVRTRTSGGSGHGDDGGDGHGD